MSEETFPDEIKTVHEYMSKVGHLRTTRIKEAQINKLRWYHDPSVIITADFEDQMYNETQKIQIVKKFLQGEHMNRMCKSVFNVKAFDESTWEEVLSLERDVPELMAKILKQEITN